METETPIDSHVETSPTSEEKPSTQEVTPQSFDIHIKCINSDGTHSLCRLDWNHAMLLDGHVGHPVTPKKIWDSIVLWNFQQRFLKKERKQLSVLSCPNCGILKQGVPEDLDAFGEEILMEM